MPDNATPDLPSNTHVPPSVPFGEPIDRSQETYRPSPYPSQKPLPHGRVSPDGRRAWPEPSLTSRVLVWGGAAIAAAALTAGGILAVRKVADMVTGNDEIDRDADRAAEQARERVWKAARGEHDPEPPRDHPRRRAEQPRERMRAPSSDRPTGPRGPRRSSQPSSFLGEIEQTAQRMTHGIQGVASALSSAVAGFRSVAGQAESVVREFTATADQIRSLLGSAGTPPAKAKPRDDFRRPRKSAVVDLRDDAESRGTEGSPQDEARVHRL